MGIFSAAATAHRARRRFFSLFRRAVPEPLADLALAETITADEVQVLDALANGTSRNYHFPARLEREFVRYMRLSSFAARLSLSLLTIALFASAPVWTPLLRFSAEQTENLMLFMEFGLIVPLFAALGLMLLRWPAESWIEWLLIGAFVIEAACIEFIRYHSEGAGLLIPPSLGIVVPVAVLTLARLSSGQSMILILSYTVIMLLGQYAAQGAMAVRDAGTWLFESMLLLVVLLSTVWARLSYRRQWAARVLLSLMAYRDSLTGLSNRRAFEEHYELAIGALGRGRTQKQLFALIDLDHFKKVNDRYGHEYGDGVLAEIGLVLSHSARRAMDMAARLGGEEFALLLYGCDAAAGRKRMEELVAAFSALGIEHQENESGVITCSVGAVIVGPHHSLSEAYRAADALLYQAKRTGRNRYYLEDLSGERKAADVELIGNPT